MPQESEMIKHQILLALFDVDKLSYKNWRKDELHIYDFFGPLNVYLKVSYFLMLCLFLYEPGTAVKTFNIYVSYITLTWGVKGIQKLRLAEPKVGNRD